MAFQWVEIVHSSRRHLSVLIRRGIHTIFAFNGKETISISVRSHLQVHRWCIVHKKQEFENYLHQMYPAELEIKDTTGSITSASYLDLLLSIGRDGQLHTSIYDKRDDFNFHIINFPFLSSNIPSSSAYGVFYIWVYTIHPGLLLIWWPGDFPVTSIPTRLSTNCMTLIPILTFTELTMEHL